MADQVLQDIKDRLDIVELIGSYIPVKRSGTNFKAACPFHHEKTPSLMISPHKQIWHCFGCGEGGDIFGFVTRQENIPFKEALQLLADRAGVKLPSYKPQAPGQEDEKQLLLRINSFASKYYQQVLARSAEAAAARDYVAKRGLSEATVTQWQIGYAPDDFHALEQALASKKIPAAALVRAGVSVKNERGQIYDRFRGRIMFPIHNYYGDVVGFSARVLQSTDDSAKYINSPETAIYYKSKILFGLFFAKQAIRQLDAVVVVEGQMDCIALHQAGFINTVATSGTALTSDQITMLGRLTKNVYFCFDADAAGATASRRAAELALPRGFKIKVVRWSGPAKDPDDLVRQGPQLWQTAVEQSLWLIDDYIRYALAKFGYNSLEQKQYVSQSIAPLVSLISDPVEQDHYIKKIAQAFTIQEAALRSLVQPTGKVSAVSQAEPVRSPSLSSSRQLLEKQVVGGIVFSPTFANFVHQQGNLEDFSDPEIRQLLEPLWQDGSLPAGIAETVLAKEGQFVVESQLESLDGNRTILERELEKSFYLLRLAQLKQRQQELTLLMHQVEQQHDPARLQALRQEFNLLVADRIKFEQKL
jgi:DNA primase